MKGSKIYSVTFLRYTNALNDTVSDWDGVSSNHIADKYLKVDRPFLIREQDIPYYQKFGGGFADLHFVGYLDIPESKYSDFSVQISGYDSSVNISPVPVPDVSRVKVGDEGFDYCSTTGVNDPNVHISTWNDTCTNGSSTSDEFTIHPPAGISINE